MQTSQTTSLLNTIYQNAQMGVDSTQRLIELVEDKPFLSVLIAQRNRYQDVYDQVIQMADHELKGQKTIDKLSTNMMINFQTIKDKSPSHLAGMMVQAIPWRHRYDQGAAPKCGRRCPRALLGGTLAANAAG